MTDGTRPPSENTAFGGAYGRYRLLERIGVGGMAEVFKAKSLGVEGFEKLLVIKRIVPRLVAHPAFVKMFIHEAKLAVRLSHANIVQVFDLGRFDPSEDVAPTYFIAMEYVAGLDAATMLSSLRQHRRGVEYSLPIAAAVYIAGEVAKALDHAHRRTDEQGRALSIVHRDISPHNVLVSWDGDVKVTDFGIAKANDALDGATGESDGVNATVSGKLGYMSPEQARGEATDSRSDLFSLGILLYQLLAGENPFAAPTRVETARRIAAGEYPPIGLARPDVPASLVAIIDRLLAKAREHRTNSAAEVFEELLAFAYTTGERFGAADLAELLLPLRAVDGEPELAVVNVLDTRSSSDEKTPVEVPQRAAEKDGDDGSSEPAGGDRREVTVLALPFLSRPGRDDAESMVPDPERMPRLRDVLERHGAWLEQRAADRLVAIFGLGDTDGRDGEAAVRAALSLVRERGVSEVRGAGVHSGPISVDNGGLPLNDDRLAALVATAVRLACAVEGQVVLSPITARLVRRSFMTEPLPPEARALVEGVTVRGPLSFESARTRFVGRRTELKRLGAVLATANRGEAQLVLLQGKTGIGKSRFLYEATRRLERGKFNVAFYACACPLNGSSEPWSALREMLHVLCGTQADDDAERLLEVRPRLRALGLHDEEANGLLSLLGAPVGLTSGELRAAIRSGFARMVASLCKDKLHGFAFDDAQAIDSETYDAVLRIIQGKPSLRALFLFSQRGDAELESPHNLSLRALQSKRRLHVVELGELTERETVELLELQVGARSLPPELLAHVRSCAGGHPLFVEELARELCDTGFVQVTSGVATVRGVVQPTAPRTLRTLIADRVSRLAQRERRVLQALATLGEPANTTVLASTLDQVLPTTDRHLATLEQKGLVARTAVTQVRFASPLYQEIVLDAMAATVSQELHAAAAAVYASAPRGGGEVAERLAVHLLGAGEKVPAVEAFWSAGRERRALGQVEAAVRLMMRGAALAEMQSRGVDQLLGWLTELGSAVAHSRNAPGLRDVVGSLVREVKQRGDARQRVVVLVEAARALAAINLFDEGFVLLEEVQLGEVSDRTLEAAVLAAECELAGRQGLHARALRACARLELLEPELDARTVVAMSVARAANGEFDLALALLERVAARGGEDDLPLQALLAKHRAVVHFYRRDFVAAARESSTSARLALAAGLRFEAALGLHNLGDACDRIGEHPRAYAAFIESLELSRQLDHDRLSNVNQLHLSMLDGLRNSEGAEEKLKALTRYADARGYLSDAMGGRYLMARLFAAHGSHERARRILGEVCREAEERGDGLIAADARELLAKLATRS